MKTRSFLLSLCSWLLIASGAFLAFRGGFDYWESHRGQREAAAEWSQAESQEMEGALERQAANSQESTRVVPKTTSFSKSLAGNAAEKERGSIKPGSAVAKLLIPRFSTVLYVVEGTDDQDLRRGPGHLEGTVMPGQNGNCVIAGHRDTHFNVLKNIQKGDEIELDRAGRKFVYKVEQLSIVEPDNTQSLRPTSDAELNLITCFPFQYVGAAPRRFVVRAKLENRAA